MFPRYCCITFVFGCAPVLLFCWCLGFVVIAGVGVVNFTYCPLHDGTFTFIRAHMQNVDAPHTYSHWLYPELWSYTDHCETNRKATFTIMTIALNWGQHIAIVVVVAAVLDNSSWNTSTIENPELWTRD